MTHTNNKQIAVDTQFNKHQFYNLLFSGKISIKEYLDGLRHVEKQSQKEVKSTAN